MPGKMDKKYYLGIRGKLGTRNYAVGNKSSLRVEIDSSVQVDRSEY